METGWTKKELRKLQTFRFPYSVQEFLDAVPYRCEDEFPPPTRVLRDGKAHCFDGALFAAAAIRRMGLQTALVNLRAVRDDDHLLCIYRSGPFWGSVAKSNFPSLRSREPVYKTLRELVMSYFDFYCNLDREKSLRAYSIPLWLKSSKYDEAWEWQYEAADVLGDRMVERRHIQLITRPQEKSLRLIDERLFRAQMVGVNLKGAYGG